jgi:hypothetical protein
MASIAMSTCFSDFVRATHITLKPHIGKTVEVHVDDIVVKSRQSSSFLQDLEVQADHGGMKMTSCVILPAIVCYSSPEAKYGPMAVRNGNGRFWWKRFYMEPRSTRCKWFMSEWKRSRNVCHSAREAKTYAERPFGMTPVFDRFHPRPFSSPHLRTIQRSMRTHS